VTFVIIAFLQGVNNTYVWQTGRNLTKTLLDALMMSG